MVSTKNEVDTMGSTGKQEREEHAVNVRAARQVYATTYKLDVVRACLAPGASTARIALEHGINANLVRKWIVKHRRAVTSAPIESSAQPGAALVPIVIKPTRVETRRAKTAAQANQAARERATPTLGAIEIEFTHAVLRIGAGSDIGTLRALIDALTQR